jgi:hypothetical protein
MLTEIPPLFLACCTNDAYKYDLSRPFVADGFLWGTDARICVRQPKQDFHPAMLSGLMVGHRKIPPVNSMWDINADCERPNLFKLPEATWRVACDACGGNQDVYCEDCDGDRWTYSCDPMPIGDLFLISHLVGLLRHHGISQVHTGKPNQPVMFLHGRIEGMLAPMDKTRVLENLKQAV